MRNVMPSEAHRNIFCPKLVLSSSEDSVHWYKKTLEVVEADQEGPKTRLSPVFKLED